MEHQAAEAGRAAGAVPNAVEVRDLCFMYGEHKALALEHFALGRSQECAVIGPSGCGKTTFVHLLAGLLTPDTGHIRVLDHDMADMSEAQRDRFRGRHIGFVFQRFHLFPALTVRENLSIAQRLSRGDRKPQRIRDMLERLGMLEFIDRKPRELSHGQAQRVAIARALVHGPELVIADEPTSALDDSHALEAIRLLKEIAAAFDAALLVVTHDHRVRGQLATHFAMSADS